MINIEELDVSGFEGAILGMRHPMKTRDKCDSGWVYNHDDGSDPVFHYVIGEKDLALAQRLLATGDDAESKFMRMIHVQVNIRAPFYWWKEFSTYKVGVAPNDRFFAPSDITLNSESTMHTIHKRPFVLEDFSCDHLIDSYTMTKDGDNYTDKYDFSYIFDGPSDQSFATTPLAFLDDTIQMLNTIRDLYLSAKDQEKMEDAKELWYNLIQLLPSSYMQERTIDFNYQVLRRMYFARRYHKLDEWRQFCKWIEGLPYAMDLICYDHKAVKTTLTAEERNKWSKRLLEKLQNVTIDDADDIFDIAKFACEILDSRMTVEAIRKKADEYGYFNNTDS